MGREPPSFAVIPSFRSAWSRRGPESMAISLAWVVPSSLPSAKARTYSIRSCSTNVVTGTVSLSLDEVVYPGHPSRYRMKIASSSVVVGVG